MVEPEKKIPTLEALENPKAALELFIAFQRLYEYIDFARTQLANSLKEQIKSGQLVSEDYNSLIGVLSQPLVGSDANDPLLQSIVQTFGLQDANHIFAGPTPSFRDLVSADIPDLSTSKLTSGNLSLARLDVKVLTTLDNLTEDTFGAPNLNTGKVEIKDNNGNSIFVMTTL